MSTKKEHFVPSHQAVGRLHPRFDRVLLIDDNKIDLFISETIINSVQLSREIKRELSPLNAIEQLKNAERLSEVPELIFLDLKMEQMDGFAFLEQFNQLSDFIRNKCKIVVITWSEDKNDKYRALMNPNVIRFFRKPLDAYKLKDFTYN